MFWDVRYDNDDKGPARLHAALDDAVVYEWLSGQCMHIGFRLVRERFGGYDDDGRPSGKLVLCDAIKCDRCGYLEPWRWGDEPGDPDLTPERQIWNSVPAYSQLEPLVADLRRKLEAAGWRFWLERRNHVTCTISGDGVAVGGSGATDAAATTSAIAALVRRGCVKPPPQARPRSLLDLT